MNCVVNYFPVTARFISISNSPQSSQSLMLKVIEISLGSAIISVSLWFYMIQFPYLYNKLGHNCLSLILATAKLYYQVIVIPCSVQFVVSTIRSEGIISVGPLISLVAIFLNNYVVLPKVFKAGIPIKSDAKLSIGDLLQSCADSGFWHKLALFLTLVMALGCVVNLLLLVE